MGKQILITGTNSYVGTSFKQYIEKKNGNMPLEDRWHVTFVSVRNSEWKKMDFSKYGCNCTSERTAGNGGTLLCS